MKFRGRLIDLPNWRVSATCLMLAFCTSINNGFISSVLNIPQFTIEHFVNKSYTFETGQKLTTMTESYLWSGIVTQRQIGQFIGTVITPFLTGRAGRKGCVMINSIILLIGLLMQFASEPSGVWAILLVGRLIWGVGCGVIAVIIPMLMTEIAPQRSVGFFVGLFWQIGVFIKKRYYVRFEALTMKFVGALASLHGMALGFGSFIADLCGLPEVLGTRRDWHYEYLVMVVLQIFQIVVFGIFCPESPKDLFIRKNDVEKTIKSIKFYQSPEPDELERILQKYALERHNTDRSSQIKRLLTTKRYRMSVLLGVGATMCYAFGAMQIVTNYSTELITHVGGMSYLPFAGKVSLGVGLLRFLAVFPSMYIVERAGRRPLLLFSLWGCVVSFVAFLIIYAVYGAGKGTPAGLAAGMAFFMLFYGFMFSIGCQTIGTFLPSELVPTQERSANQAFAVMWRFVFAFITTFAFYPLQQATNWGCWLELIIPLLLTAAFMHKYMPETKNKTANEVLAELNHEKYEETTLLSGPRYSRLENEDSGGAKDSDYGSVAN